MLIDKNLVKKNREDEFCETKNWQSNRWKNVSRDYTVEDVKKLISKSKGIDAKEANLLPPSLFTL